MIMFAWAWQRKPVVTRAQVFVGSTVINLESNLFPRPNPLSFSTRSSSVGLLSMEAPALGCSTIVTPKQYQIALSNGERRSSPELTPAVAFNTGWWEFNG